MYNEVTLKNNERDKSDYRKKTQMKLKIYL